MRKMFQTEWQGILFSEFAELSSTELASADFYQTFYKEFFNRYQGWQQLSASWRREKEDCARHITSLVDSNSRILSVGCGVGYMEHFLHDQLPHLNLFIHEVAPAAWHWVGTEFSQQHKLLGMIPECLPVGAQFDLVYLSAVDYALDDDALVNLLAAIRPFLAKPAGRCLLISASLQDEPETLSDKIRSLLRSIKALVATSLDRVGMHSRGQFWGWTRTRGEYRAIMERAGYSDIKDGFIDPDRRSSFWVAGS